MPDERQDSIRRGINAPEESPSGKKAAEENRRRAGEGLQMDGALGGTTDADTAGEEADANARRGGGSD